MQLTIVRGVGRRLAALALMTGLITMCGCGASTGEVTGKVTYKGKSLKGGTITFVHTQGKPSRTGSIEEDGSYKLSKVPVGNVKVCVETKSLNTGPTAPERKYSPPAGQTAPGYSKGSGGSEENRKNYVPIPDDYSDPAKTKLTYTVKGGTQVHDIPLD